MQLEKLQQSNTKLFTQWRNEIHLYGGFSSPFMRMIYFKHLDEQRKEKEEEEERNTKLVDLIQAWVWQKQIIVDNNKKKKAGQNLPRTYDLISAGFTIIANCNINLLSILLKDSHSKSEQNSNNSKNLTYLSFQWHFQLLTAPQ